MNKTIKNLLFRFLYEFIALCAPLITAPYVSRILGADSLGDFSFTQSIVTYFTLIAMLGVGNYGSRTIAMLQNNKEEITKNFWSIYLFQVFTSSLSLLLYISYCLLFVKSNFELAISQSFLIISCIFDVSWLFSGIEEFKVTSLRSSFVKLITVVLILTLVKGKDDLIVYALIMSIGSFFSSFVLIPIAIKKIGFYRPTFSCIMKHFKPIIVLFIPLLGTTIYHIMDKTMLGLASTNFQSGYYYAADKVMSIPLSLIYAGSSVMLPRMSSLVASKDVKTEIRVFYISFEGLIFLSTGMSIGLSLVASDFVPVFFGEGYNDCIPLIYIFSFIMIIKTVSNIIKVQYLIPRKKEKIYTFSVFFSAGVNLIANYLLIFVLNLGAFGACLGTLIAELTCSIIYFISINKEIKMSSVLTRSLVYVVPSLFMIIAVLFIKTLEINIIIRLVFEIFSGAFVYLLVSFFIWILFKKSFLFDYLKQLYLEKFHAKK